MTISPPSNVRLSSDEPARVLAHGIDSLVLAVDVKWQDEKILEALARLRDESAQEDSEIPGRLKVGDGSGDWLFTVKPHGAKGYAYLLESGEMSWRVGDWMTPQTRPSVMVSIRSETLWTHGPQAVVDRICAIISAHSGEIVTCKVSRVDLCVDVLLPAEAWNRDVQDNLVTRAEHVAPYFSKQTLTGIQIGKGNMVARFYDKVREIAVKSNKIWMFDVWGIDSAADDHRIIRVEFEVKREGIKALGLDSFNDLTRALPNLWAYCTQRWLRLADDPRKHATRQKLLPWWSVVQGGFKGAQEANALIRAKAIKADGSRLATQMLGYMTSLVALHFQGDMIAPDETLDLASYTALVMDTLRRAGWDDAEFTERVKRKQAKFQRHAEQFKAAERARAAAGVSYTPARRRRRTAP